jgi:hypothetical protein
MTPRQKQVYSMRHAGHSFPHIARALSISPQAARSLYQAARRYFLPTGKLEEFFRQRRAELDRGNIRKSLSNLRSITAAIHFLQVK